MILYDTHTHSTLSHDGGSTLEEMAKAAAQKGLKGICLSEHCDFRTYPEGSICRYFEDEILNARKNLPDYGVQLPFAVEIAQASVAPEEVSELIGRNDYDMIIGSQHLLPGNESVLRRSYKDRSDCEKVLDIYLDALLETAETTDYDTLAHMDYPLRYFYFNAGILLKPEDRQKKVDDILKAVIRRGKALELNTAVLRKGYPSLMETTLCRFKELGGRYVTVGSDAHRTTELCDRFPEAEEAIKRAGFTTYTVYHRRKPVEISFESE